MTRVEVIFSRKFLSVDSKFLMVFFGRLASDTPLLPLAPPIALNFLYEQNLSVSFHAIHRSDVR